MTIMSGRPVAEQLQLELKQSLDRFSSPLQLAILLVGQNAASLTYIKQKIRLANVLGIEVILEQFDQTATSQTLIDAIKKHNQAPTTAILVQLPLPAQIETQSVLEAIAPNKDADGLNPINLGRLMANQPHLIPATAQGVMALLRYYQVATAGRQVVVVGRSRLVGQPIAQLLLQANATVTIAHRQTTDLGAITSQADILVVAAGQPGLIQPNMVKPGAAVIDVGLTKTDQGLQGDVHPGVSNIASLSPVPGGVGPLTVTYLMKNVIRAAEIQLES